MSTTGRVLDRYEYTGRRFIRMQPAADPTVTLELAVRAQDVESALDLWGGDYVEARCIGGRWIYIPSDSYPLTTLEAATALGLSERQVQQLAAHGQIAGAFKEGRDWRFPRKPRVIRPKRGRPVHTPIK